MVKLYGDVTPFLTGQVCDIVGVLCDPSSLYHKHPTGSVVYGCETSVLGYVNRFMAGVRMRIMNQYTSICRRKSFYPNYEGESKGPAIFFSLMQGSQLQKCTPITNEGVTIFPPLIQVSHLGGSQLDRFDCVT